MFVFLKKRVRIFLNPLQCSFSTLTLTITLTHSLIRAKANIRTFFVFQKLTPLQCKNIICLHRTLPV